MPEVVWVMINIRDFSLNFLRLKAPPAKDPKVSPWPIYFPKTRKCRSVSMEDLQFLRRPPPMSYTPPLPSLPVTSMVCSDLCKHIVPPLYGKMLEIFFLFPTIYQHLMNGICIPYSAWCPYRIPNSEDRLQQDYKVREGGWGCTSYLFPLEFRMLKKKKKKLCYLCSRSSLSASYISYSFSLPLHNSSIPFNIFKCLLRLLN